MSWDVHFVNGHTRRVQVAIKFYQPSCGQYGRPWGTRGWWLIDPGQSAYVLDTNNRFFYYYAECVSDGRVWSGDSPTPVYQPAFDSCVSLGFCRCPRRLYETEGSPRQQLVAPGIAASRPQPAVETRCWVDIAGPYDPMVWFGPESYLKLIRAVNRPAVAVYMETATA